MKIDIHFITLELEIAQVLIQVAQGNVDKILLVA